MSLFGYFLSGLVNVGIVEDPFMLCITSPESHIYKWGGFLGQGIINMHKFLEAFSVMSRRPFYPSLSRRYMEFQRYDVDF